MAKKILIMGASSGIGYATTLQFIKAGYKVGIAARREESLKELKAAFNDKIEYEVIDITASDATDKLDILINKLGKIDIYLHVSGIGKQNIMLNSNIETNTCMTNVVGFTRIINHVFNYFKNNHIHGHIAAVSSIAGTKGLGVAPAYSATKRFQNTYIECLQQLSFITKANITFTDIRPGFVATPLLNDENKYPLMMNADYVAKKIIKAINKKKRIIVIDWKYQILVFFWRLIPRQLWIRLPIKTKTK